MVSFSSLDKNKFFNLKLQIMMIFSALKPLWTVLDFKQFHATDDRTAVKNGLFYSSSLDYISTTLNNIAAKETIT